MNKTITLLVALLGLAAVVSATAMNINHREIYNKRIEVLKAAEARDRTLGLRSGAVQPTQVNPTAYGGLIGCIRGFAYGLQFDPAQPGTCYDSIDSSLTIVAQIK